jgi:hypothetical protein
MNFVPIPQPTSLSAKAGAAAKPKSAPNATAEARTPHRIFISSLLAGVDPALEEYTDREILQAGRAAIRLSFRVE